MATMTLEVPTTDLDMFKILVQRMGWMLQRDSNQATFSPDEIRAAKERGRIMRQFIDKFRTDDITEEEILAECDAVRQEMYEERLQKKKDCH